MRDSLRVPISYATKHEVAGIDDEVTMRTIGQEHPPYLIGPNRREEYAQAVFNWLSYLLEAYSFDNVRQQGGHYMASDNKAPPFLFECGEIRIAIHPASPTNVLLACRGSYAAALRQAYRLAERLLEEARPCDRKRLSDMRPKA